MNFSLNILGEDAVNVIADSLERVLQVAGFERFNAGPPDLGVEQVPGRPPPTPDGFLCIKSQETSARFVLEAKSKITTDTLALAITQLTRYARQFDRRPLLLSTYISDKVGDQLRSEGISYADTAGNACLMAPHIFLWFRGFKPKRPFAKEAIAFRLAGLKLISKLLTDLDAVNQPYRDLAEVSGTSLGSVSRVMAELRAQGFIHRVAPQRSAITRTDELIDRWTFGYGTVLRPALNPLTFRTTLTTLVDQIPKFLDPSTQERVLIGGELAAAALTGNLRPQSVVLHIESSQLIPAIMRNLRLVPERDGNVTLMPQLAHMNSFADIRIENTPVAHPLYVYAETLHGRPDIRLRETAQLLYDKYLLPRLA